MRLDSLIDWIKLLFISCRARSKNFSTVCVFCSFCLAHFRSVLLDTRMVDGIQKGQQFLKVVEGKVTGREYWSGDGQCGESKWISLFVGKEGGGGRGCLLKVIWTGLMVRRVKGLHPAKQSWKDGFFWRIDHVECWAPSSVPGNKTPENKIWGFTENHSPPASHRLIKAMRNVPHGFSELWKGLKSADVQFLVVKPPAENQRALPPASAQQHPSPYHNPASDEGCHKEMPKVCSPYTPPSRSFSSKNMNQALKRAVSEGWFSCDYCLGERWCLVFLQTALFAEQNTLGSCPIDTFLFKQQIQLQSEMQI